MTDSTKHEDIIRALIEQERKLENEREQQKESQTGYAELIKQLLPVFLNEIDQYAEISDTVVDKIAPVVAKYAERFRAFNDEQDVKSFNTLCAGGMEPEEAIALLIARKNATAASVGNLNSNLGK